MLFSPYESGARLSRETGAGKALTRVNFNNYLLAVWL